MFNAITLEQNENTASAKKSRRRKRIMDAATHEFTLRGYAGTEVDAVARRAGSAKGTIYLYFNDKANLFEKSMDDWIECHSRQFFHQQSVQFFSTPDALKVAVKKWSQTDNLEKIRIVMYQINAQSHLFPELVSKFNQHILIPCISRVPLPILAKSLSADHQGYVGVNVQFMLQIQLSALYLYGANVHVVLPNDLWRDMMLEATIANVWRNFSTECFSQNGLDASLLSCTEN